MEFLPQDILSFIYDKLNIDELGNLFNAIDNLCCDQQFWLNYFKSYKLDIIEEQENNKDWVIEFKIISMYIDIIRNFVSKRKFLRYQILFIEPNL